MQMEHKVLTEDNYSVIYINIYLDDKIEFSKDVFCSNAISTSLRGQIAKYLCNKVNPADGSTVIIAINNNVVTVMNTYNTDNGLELANKYIKKKCTSDSNKA